jgi:hypothetical protein
LCKKPWDLFLAQIRAAKLDADTELRKTATAETAKWGYNLDDKGHFEEQVKEAWTEFIFDSEGPAEPSSPSLSPFVTPATIAGESSYPSSPTPQAPISMATKKKDKQAVRQPRLSARPRDHKPNRKIRETLTAKNPTPEKQVIKAFVDLAEVPDANTAYSKNAHCHSLTRHWRPCPERMMQTSRLAGPPMRWVRIPGKHLEMKHSSYGPTLSLQLTR